MLNVIQLGGDIGVSMRKEMSTPFLQVVSGLKPHNLCVLHAR